jgi:hypothetical protein
VNLSVNQTVTWSLQSGTGTGKPIGQLLNETGTTATYMSPALTNPPSCNSSGTTPAQRVSVVATSTTDTTQSATIAIAIAQSFPCVATVPTYDTCPANGSVLKFSGLGGQLTQVGLFTSFAVEDGGSAVDTPFGVGPFTWQMTSGSLPVGLSLVPGTDSSSVLITGTAVSPGCSTFALQITDSTGVASMEVPFNLVVIPPGLKAQVASYPNVYNYSQNIPGVPYLPIAVTVSGGIGPYTWVQDPTGVATLPPGLGLTSAASSSGVAVISGTPDAGDNNNQNGSGSAPGLYPTTLQINDSQQPYPAVGLATLNSMSALVLPSFCSPAPSLLQNSVPAADSYLQGSLAFLLRGFDANGPVAIAGSVTVDGGGNIVGGVEDVTRSSGSQSLSILPAGSSYNVGVVSPSSGNSYNRGCMTLADSAGKSTTFAFSLGSCSNNFTEGGEIVTHDMACGITQNNGQNEASGFYRTGRIIEFDDNTGGGTRGSGILRWQDPSVFSSGLSGRYAFGLSGGNSAGGRYAMAGSLQAGSGNLSSVAADVDDAGTLNSQLTGGTGTYNNSGSCGGISSSCGRGTASLTVGPTSYNLALYAVSSSEALLLTTDTLSPSHPILGGEAITTATSFSHSSLQNSHMFYIGGLASNGPDVSVGILTFDGVGSFTGVVYEDQAGTLGKTSASGAYFVDTNTGRAPFTAPLMGQTLGNHAFVAYLIPPAPGLAAADCSQPASCVSGFLVGTDSTAQDGILEFQTSLTQPPPPFTNRDVVGDFAYGTAENLDSKTPSVQGNVSATPSASSSTSGSLGPASGGANFPFLQDVSYGDPNYCMQSNCLLLIPNEYLAGSYSINADGTGTFGGGTISITNGNVLFYIDESPINLHPTIMVAEQ